MHSGSQLGQHKLLYTCWAGWAHLNEQGWQAKGSCKHQNQQACVRCHFVAIFCYHSEQFTADSFVCCFYRTHYCSSTVVKWKLSTRAAVQLQHLVMQGMLPYDCGCVDVKSLFEVQLLTCP
jgi:hypothetical protein